MIILFLLLFGGKLRIKYGNPSSYIFELDGVVYQLPFAYQKLANHGWSPSSTFLTTDTLDGLGVEHLTMTKGKSSIDVYIYNPSKDARPLKDCKVGGIVVTASNNVEFCLTKGITCSSTDEDIKAAYDMPDNYKGYGNFYSLIYRFGNGNAKAQFYIYFKDATQNSISLSNFPAGVS